ncbi:MAG: OmpA family protein [Saprospiraceae bacterium]|nr:OmpA family protein [Saprospiraceae bacterium]
MTLRRNLQTGLLSMLFSVFTIIVISQDVTLYNPSFEDYPHPGAVNEYNIATEIDGWFDCATYNGFAGETPPDIHDGSNQIESFWKNTMHSAHGRTYLGMVVRDNESWEALSQRLATPLRKGRCYEFSIYLARSDNYWSSRRVDDPDDPEQNFIKPAVFQLWGGTGRCGDRELLAVSDPVDYKEWKQNTFIIEPKFDYHFITIQVFYETPVLWPYNGHILVDGASEFKLVDCDEPEYVVFEREKKEKEIKTRKMPAHKAKSRKTEVFNREKRQNEVDTIVYVRPSNEKILAELDRKTVKKGQRIKIDKLYFEADTTSIGVESYQVLNEVYEFLNDNTDIIVEIGGHTNGIPPHTYCDKLSQARAEAVAKYLINKGIDSERVQSKGYGKRRPISSNSTDEGRKKNQRVEIRIISMDS